MNKKRFPEIVLFLLLSILLITGRGFTGEGDSLHSQKPPAKHQGHIHHEGHHRFEDAEAWAKIFEVPERDAWQKPDTLIKALNLKEEMIIADISLLPTSILPAEGRSMPASRLSKVVFPEPEGPIKALKSPPGISRLMFLKTGISRLSR